MIAEFIARWALGGRVRYKPRCDCWTGCDGKVVRMCFREPGHEGPHSCILRIRDDLKPGDHIWDENEEEDN